MQCVQWQDKWNTFTSELGAFLRVSDKLLPNWEMMEMRRNEPAYLLRSSKAATCPVIVISFGNLPSLSNTKKKKKRLSQVPLFLTTYSTKAFQELTWQISRTWVSAFPYHDNVIRPLSFLKPMGEQTSVMGLEWINFFCCLWCLCVLSSLLQTSWSVP